MKLIIDIPEKNFIKDDLIRFFGCYSQKLDEVIKNGTPLPKGHGRLIDADVLTEQLETVANDEWNKQVGANKGLEDAIDIVDDAQTIVKADKESE